MNDADSPKVSECHAVINQESTADLVQMITRGLPVEHLAALRADLGLPVEKLAACLGIPKATLHRRLKTRLLTPDESDRVVRFRRLLTQASQIFGSMEAGAEWLRTPQFGLGEQLPIDYARTEVGAREVEKLLARIDHGVLP